MAGQFGRRSLIVNADDFGMSAGVNRGIIEAHCRGIVTSTSLMVRWGAAAEAVRLSRDCPRLGLGLHVDLGEWTYRDGDWMALYEVVSLRNRDEVLREVTRQLDLFRDLTGRNPTHLDSHQHAHREEPVRSIMMDLAQHNSIPLRHFSPRINYCGAFYGQAANGTPYPEGISTSSLLRVLAELSPGVTELCCHPGLDDNLQTMYCHERFEEVKTLCDESVSSAIRDQEIELCCFNDLAPAQLAGDRA
ncbi:MAG: ChbG/HpnK family deacetylase [Planctomycetaceae bacterium]